MTHAVCTLFEGHYHLGVAALINSLHASGYTGPVVCGHRGHEPPWAHTARALANGIRVQFIRVSTDVHLTHHKPEFLQQVWTQHCPGADQLYYFDPDIVVKAPWSVVARWAGDGIALCEDVNGYLPARHPYRLAWADFLHTHGFELRRPLDRYYNAGFIGLPRAHESLLAVWSGIIARAAEVLGSLSTIKVSGPHALLHTPDQDALNMALMVSDAPINGTGPEGMDFAAGGHLLSHAIGARKPWRGGFFRDALRGRPPGNAQKSFFRFVDSPLRVLPAGQLARLRLSLLTGALLGRLYRRA
jgi:hypothetical protein